MFESNQPINLKFKFAKESNKLFELFEIEEDDLPYFSERNITTTQPILLIFYLDKSFEEIGFVQFELRAINKNAYITYYIKKEHRNKGFGKAVVKKAIEFAFEELNLNRITAEVYEYNNFSIKLLKKLGFVEEGRIRFGKYHKSDFWDIIIYGMLKEEYLKSKFKGTEV